jgi:hypothetical protein
MSTSTTNYAGLYTSVQTAQSYASCAYSFSYINGNKCVNTPTSNKVGCQCHNTDYITVDSGNTAGTAGLCFIGSASAPELRLLTVRKVATGGAIFGWPQSGSSTSFDQTYIPSLTVSDYTATTDGSTLYGQRQISSFSSSATTSTAGVARSSANNFRNCAAKTASSSSTVSFVSDTSYVFWVELNAPDGYAITRADFSGGLFVSPVVPVWNGGATVNSATGGSGGNAGYATDVAIVGIAFADNGGTKAQTQTSPAIDYLYAASTTKVYASFNAFNPVGTVTWYQLVTLGAGEAQPFGAFVGNVIYSGGSANTAYSGAYLGSEHRGIAYTPPAQCNAAQSVFRALEKDTDDVAEGETVPEEEIA